MSGSEPNFQLSRGVALRYPSASMHGSGNQSYMDRLYVLPRTSERVLSNNLQTRSKDDQSEVAVYWFLLNCRRRDGRSDALETSGASSAIGPLTSEFDRSKDGDGLGHELLERIADHLPESWERLGGAPEVYRRAMVHAATSSQPSLQERRAAILEAVEQAKSLLMQEQPIQQQQGKPPTLGEPEEANKQSEPGPGHNSEGEKALSNDQIRELNAKLDKIRDEIRLGSPEGDKAARKTVDEITPLKNALGRSISTMLSGMLSGAASQGSKIIGSEIVNDTKLHWLFQYIGDLIVSLSVWPFT